MDLNCPDRPTWKYVYADYREVDVSDLYNDEVDGALFSPATYEEFIFPYEERIARGNLVELDITIAVGILLVLHPLSASFRDFGFFI